MEGRSDVNIVSFGAPQQWRPKGEGRGERGEGEAARAGRVKMVFIHALFNSVVGFCRDMLRPEDVLYAILLLTFSTTHYGSNWTWNLGLSWVTRQLRGNTPLTDSTLIALPPES